MNISAALPTETKANRVQCLDDWRIARHAADNATDDSPERVTRDDLADGFSNLLCNTPANSPEGILAQIEWMHEDLGYYIEKNVGPDRSAIFSVLKQSVQNIGK